MLCEDFVHVDEPCLSLPVWNLTELREVSPAHTHKAQVLNQLMAVLVGALRCHLG